MKSAQLKGILITLFAGIFWGFSGVCGQYLTQREGLSVDFLTMSRMLSAGLLLTLLSLVSDRSRFVRLWRSPKGLAKCCVFGICGVLFCQFTYLKAIYHSNAGTGTVLQYVGPVLVMLVVCLQRKRLPSGAQLAALLLAMTGVLLSATHGNLQTLAISPAALAWGLMSAVTLVIYTMYPMQIIREYGAVHITGPSMLAGGLVMVAFAPWRDLPAVSKLGWVALIAMVVVGTALAYTMYLQGVKLLGAVKGSLCSCIEPVSAAVLAAVLMGAQFGLWDIIGALCIISTVFVLTLHKEKKNDQSYSME